MEIAPVVVGFFGHTDHGKTSLIKLLTGADTMRLAEEKRRGLSIDMGFASFKAPGLGRIGVLDSPGHDSFLKNMIAAASGASAAVLTVAADDGVTPRTREHLRVLEILGIQRGIVALTKTDLVDEELVRLATEEIRGLARGTFLDDAPVLPVSTKTKKGFGEFYDALVELAARPLQENADADRPFFMPVQRVFSLEGSGTVITGIPLRGRVAPGGDVVIHPSGKRCRVRSVEAYHRKADRVEAGHSAALNVAGAGRGDAWRGAVAAEPGAFEPTRFFSVRLETYADAPALYHNVELTVYLNTLETGAKLRLLFDDDLPPGGGAHAQLVLDKPAAAFPGNGFVVRTMSPRVVAGGGVILSADHGRRRRRESWILNDLLKREQCLGDETAAVSHLLESASGAAAVDKLKVNSGLGTDAVRRALAALARSGGAVYKPESGLALHANILGRIASSVRAEIGKQCREHPLRGGVKLSELRKLTSVERWVLDEALGRLVENGEIEITGDMARSGAVDEKLTAAQAAVLELVEKEVEDSGVRGVNESNILSSSNGGSELAVEAIGNLVRRRKIIRTPGPKRQMLLFHMEVALRAKEIVEKRCRENGHVRFIDLKDGLGTTFTYAAALVEYFREEGILRREGDADVLVRKN